jgi:hypothetical protein
MSSRILEHHNDHACRSHSRLDFIAKRNIGLFHHDLTHASHSLCWIIVPCIFHEKHATPFASTRISLYSRAPSKESWPASSAPANHEAISLLQVYRPQTNPPLQPATPTLKIHVAVLFQGCKPLPKVIHMTLPVNLYPTDLQRLEYATVR